MRAQRRALVLGHRAVAEYVAAGLEAEGIHAEFPFEHGLSVPLPGDQPDAREALRGCLRSFAATRQEGELLFVHPGVSLWAERPELGTIGQELNIEVVCPPARAVNLFGNRFSLLSEAEKLGIPNLMLHADLLHSVREIQNMALGGGRKLFPFVLKPVRGAGSFFAYDEQDLWRRLPLWLEQLQKNLGEAIVIGERYLESARLITIPFARLRDGTFEIFSLVDASLQCRGRKLIEICPAPELGPEVERQLKQWTVRLADGLGFVGVGQFSFLVDSSRAFLLEGLARLNTAFPLWQKVSGTNVVAWQLAAMGAGPIPHGEDPQRSDWSAGLSFRIYAEDPILQVPQPGKIREFSEKRSWSLAGAQAEACFAIETGGEVADDTYGLLGLVFAGADQADKALTLARGVLGEIWISGSLRTNERFVGELLAHPWIREGIFHSTFVDDEFVPEIRPPDEWVVASAALAALAAGGEAAGRWVISDRRVKPDPGVLRWSKGPEYWYEGGLCGLSGGLLLNGTKVRVSVFPVFEGRWQVRIGDRVMAVRRMGEAPAAASKRVRRVLALVHGRVHAILFQEGALLPAHEPILIIESLGVLVSHALPVASRVLHWSVSAEQTVDTGQELGEFELEGGNG